MEFLTLLLSALLGILAPVGIVADTLAETTIRDRLHAVEQLAVRVDNAPSHQLLNGRVDKLRLAGRGIFPLEGIRIAAVDLETDEIALDPQAIRRGKIEIERPLNLATQIVLTQADLNQALQSETIATHLKNLSIGAIGGSAQQLQQYDFTNPAIDLLPNERFRLQVTLKPQGDAGQASHQASQSVNGTQIHGTQIHGTQIHITVESSLKVISGRQLQLIEPSIRINDGALPEEIVTLFVQGINQQLDLDRLEPSGITARILKLSTQNHQLTLSTFIRLDPRFTPSGT